MSEEPVQGNPVRYLAIAFILCLAASAGSDDAAVPVEIPGGPDKAAVGERTPEARAEAMVRYGGSPAAEAAVKAALRWLAAHQDDDGKWSATEFIKHCPPGDVCSGVAPEKLPDLQGSYDIAETGLSLLAFLGHGETHREGEFRVVAQRALDYLLSQQDGHSGRFGREEHANMYNQAIAALALSEAYAMTGDESLKNPVIRALGYICQTQQKSGGWDYTEAQTDRSDTSVTGWQVMALKSAHAAHVSVPWKTTYGILHHFERVTDEDGRVGYTQEPTSRHGIGLTAVGMLSNLALGMGRDHPIVERQAKTLLTDLPAWYKLRSPEGHDHSEYYWYYGTLAMFQKGGADWEKWNGAIRDTLVRQQCATGHRAGSWDPDGYWARGYGGRVYMTALMTLTLEVYYRYLPMYESQDTLHAGAALVEALRADENPTRKAALLARLVELRDPKLPELLKKLLDDENLSLRFAAAKYLAQAGDPSAIPVIAKGLESAEPSVRFNAIRQLEEIDHPDAIPPLIRALNDPLEANALRAEAALEAKTGFRPPFGHAENAEERRKIIASWDEWWKNNRERLAAVPDVRGEVAAVREGGKRVLVQVGENDPVRVGMRFNVYRGGKVVGIIEVTEVMRGGFADGTVAEWSAAGGVQKGDKVATRSLAQEKDR